MEGRLALPRCASCGLLIAYPRPRCPRCHGASLSWETLSGLGTVYAFTVIHRPADPSFADDVPYVVALVDLAEGARIMTNIIECSPDSVRIGMDVEVRFRPVSDDAALPLFAAVGAAAP